MLNQIRFTLLKIVLKSVEFILMGVTTLRYFKKDSTLILIENFTDLQKNAQKKFDTFKTNSRQNAPQPIRILIVIPFRDRWDLTSNCLKSLTSQHLDVGTLVRVVLVDNGSTETETENGICEYEKIHFKNFEFKRLRLDYPFNFSKLNNDAVRTNIDFNPDVLFFVNNDITFPEANSLRELVEFLVLDSTIGALGCTLLYPTGAIQHLFLAPGVKIVGAHPLKKKTLDFTEKWFESPRPVAAVTGAALMIRAGDFFDVEEFDENLAHASQDLDLCLKLQKRGKQNWVLPKTRLIHHESVTRKGSISEKEVYLMYEKWGDYLTKNPYFSKAFSKWSETPVLTLGEGSYPWHTYLTFLGKSKSQK